MVFLYGFEWETGEASRVVCVERIKTDVVTVTLALDDASGRKVEWRA